MRPVASPAYDECMSTSEPPKKSRRGFASMTPEKQREIATMGGKASHASGNAHEFTPEEARAAGKKSHGAGNTRKKP